MKKIHRVFLLLSLTVLILPTQAQTPTSAQVQAPAAAPATSEVKGVNPADNLTKFELLPKYTRVDDDNDVSVSTFTLKYDRAIQGVYGLNIELPLARFSSP